MLLFSVRACFCLKFLPAHADAVHTVHGSYMALFLIYCTSRINGGVPWAVCILALHASRRYLVLFPYSYSKPQRGAQPSQGATMKSRHTHQIKVQSPKSRYDHEVDVLIKSRHTHQINRGILIKSKGRPIHQAKTRIAVKVQTLCRIRTPLRFCLHVWKSLKKRYYGITDRENIPISGTRILKSRGYTQYS